MNDQTEAAAEVAVVPQTSTVKLLAFLEQLSQLDDDQLREMLPVSPGMARMGIAAAAERVPEDPAELDTTLAKCAMFLAGLQSDDARYFDVVPHVVEGELTDVDDDQDEDDDDDEVPDDDE